MRVGQSRRRDSNEQAIIKALRKIGVLVWPLSGAGVPDLLCAYHGRWTPLEIKRPKQGRLTDAQCNTRALAWYPVVATISEAVAVFQGQTKVQP